jgi:tRNA A37 threonylcarbamoyladenosine synthetase subunit TsaC/SUA5/YrdC
VTHPPLEPVDVVELQRCLAADGVAVFPSDTVYGLCCDPDSERAARRM